MEKITYLCNSYSQLAEWTLDVALYDLLIDLDFQKFKYEGTVRVSLKVKQNVVLDAVGLEILRVSSAGSNLRFGQAKDNLTVETGPFDGVLEVEFAGSIPDSLAGIYKAPYENTCIVTTHFEAAQARRMFPCVDRPDVKAEFKLAVRIDKDLEAISNMPIESQVEAGGKKLVTFQKTPRMSTYLLYLGVGKFQTQARKLGDTDVILATTPGKIKKTEFASEEAQKSIAFFNAYYEIPYALPKVHLIAVPEFAQGAMENWGAITFREILLIADSNTSVRVKMRSAMAIAHELAHQWFGDLVTMKWWDDIWLNESFATLMAYKAVDAAHPDWRIWTDFFNGEPGAETLAGAMSRDFLEHTHSIQVKVNSPEEMEQVFDAISYGKGAHVLQMIEAYVGEGAFRKGVNSYLSSHAYSNAMGEDLWSAVESASGKPVKRVMSGWVRQDGFPVVTISRHDGRLALRQERLLISGKRQDTTWPIPLIVEVNKEVRTMLMEGPENAIEVRDLKTLLVNPGRKGFYAVHYKGLDDIVWESDPSAEDRWGIVFDAFMFLISGRIGFEEYLSILKRFDGEEDALPAREVSNQLALLYSLNPSRIMETSKRIHRALLKTLEARADEKSMIFRGEVASRLAFLDPEYASNLAREFKNYLSVPPDMRLAVATGYARSTNDLEGLMQAYRESGSDEDKVKFLDAMTTFTDGTLVKKALDFVISGEVKRQDVIGVVERATENHQAKTVVWDWLQSNMRKLQELYQGTGVLSEALLAIIPLLCVGKADEAEQFFKEHMISDAEIGIRAGLEKLMAYDRLVNRM